MDASRSFKSFMLCLGLVIGLSGCAHDPYYSGPVHRPYYPHYYPYYYDYYYYPSVRVYFNYSRGYYYYPSGKRWIRSKVLPPHIRLHPRDRVITRIDSDKPYLKHQEHRKKYQPRREYRPDPQLHRKEQTHNLKSYEQHQKRQKEYETEWQKRGQKDKRR